MDLDISAGVTRLLEALRAELHQYGEMLSRLDQQQEHVLERAADEVVRSVAAVNEQATVLREVRTRRQAVQTEMARALQLGEEAEFEKLLPALPAPQRFGVEALVRENNDLLTRVQQRARQNHLLLTRSVELMQRFLQTLVPAAAPAVYTDSGSLQPAAAQPPPFYEAVG